MTNIKKYVISAILGLALIQSTAMAEEKIGNCVLTGKKGEFPIKPAIEGQLTLNVSLPAPAWLNGDTEEAVKDGFEYCMAANMAYRAGLDKLVLKNVGWDAMIAGQAKNYDLALSEISITEDRKKAVDFSIPYFSSDIGVLVKAGKKVDEKNIKDIRIGVQATTTGQSFVQDVLKPHKVAKVFPDISSLFTALQANQIDAAIVDTPVAISRANESKGAFIVAGQFATGDEYGALLPKGSANKQAIDNIIKSMQEDGTLKKLANDWLAPAWGADPTNIPYFKP